MTPPGPLWAMRHDSPTARAADHWAPSVMEFYEFVYAAGLRYSGSYGTIPRVSVWSIWNEPNQPGWLAPQWRSVGGKQVPNSPRLYRAYAAVAYAALYFSRHVTAGDTILIGELAPEGYSTPGFYTAMTPMPFLRALYCVDGAYRPLRGAAAAALGCPTSGSRAAFVATNPELFLSTGFAHHPYYFLHAPWVGASDPQLCPPGQSRPTRARPRSRVPRLRRPAAAADLPDRIRLPDRSSRSVRDDRPATAGQLSERGRLHRLEGSAGALGGTVPALRLRPRRCATRRGTSVIGTPSRPACCLPEGAPNLPIAPTRCRSGSRLRGFAAGRSCTSGASSGRPPSSAPSSPQSSGAAPTGGTLRSPTCSPTAAAT